MLPDNQPVGRPMEILLVEDGLMDARMTIEALREGQVQHRLTLIRDGVEAMEFLHQDGRFAKAPRPDLVLLDLMLPKKSGLDVLKEVRHDFEQELNLLRTSSMKIIEKAVSLFVFHQAQNRK